MRENLMVLIEEETHVGNLVQLPQENDVTTLVVLNRENVKENYFLVYDIRRNCFTRKISKKCMTDQAFCVDHTGRILCYVDDDTIYLKMCKVPNSASLNDELRPRHKLQKKQMTCTELCESKVAFKDRIYKDMFIYHMFKKDMRRAEQESGIFEEQNMWLLVRKYEEACAQPFKLRANREFLMLQKILLRDAQKDNRTTGNDYQEKCPLVNVEYTKRIELYDDELTYKSDLTTIDLV